MSNKLIATAVIAAALAATPFASAHADGWHHWHGGGGYHHGGRDFGLIGGLVAGVVGATVAVATLPFDAVEAVAAPAPTYYATAPAPAYYGYAPAYPQRRVVYSYPQPYPYAYAYPTYGYPPQ